MGLQPSVLTTEDQLIQQMLQDQGFMQYLRSIINTKQVPPKQPAHIIPPNLHYGIRG